MTRTLAGYFSLFVLVTVFVLPSDLHALELYFMFSVGDAQEHQVTLADGTKPTRVDSKAEGYCLLIPEGSTLEVFGGAAELVQKPHTSGGTASTQVSDEAVARAGDQEPASTDWLELRTSTASVYFFSPEGEDEGDFWSQQKPAMFMKKRTDGRLLTWIGKRGTKPKGCD